MENGRRLDRIAVTVRRVEKDPVRSLMVTNCYVMCGFSSLRIWLQRWDYPTYYRPGYVYAPVSSKAHFLRMGCPPNPGTGRKENSRAVNSKNTRTESCLKVNQVQQG